MQQLLYGGLTLIVVVASLAIGGGVVVLTLTNVQNITGNSSIMTSIANNGGNALVIFASILGIVALALGGGMAIAYLVNYVGGNMGRQ